MLEKLKGSLVKKVTLKNNKCFLGLGLYPECMFPKYNNPNMTGSRIQQSQMSSQEALYAFTPTPEGCIPDRPLLRGHNPKRHSPKEIFSISLASSGDWTQDLSVLSNVPCHLSPHTSSELHLFYRTLEQKWIMNQKFTKGLKNMSRQTNSKQSWCICPDIGSVRVTVLVRCKHKIIILSLKFCKLEREPERRGNNNLPCWSKFITS